MTRNSPPKLGGEPARTKSEQAGWFPCRYWQLREPPRPRLRSGTPPNLGGECPHSNSFTAPMTADNTASCETAATVAMLYFCAKPEKATKRHKDHKNDSTSCFFCLFVAISLNRSIMTGSGGWSVMVVVQRNEVSRNRVVYILTIILSVIVLSGIAAEFSQSSQPF